MVGRVDGIKKALVESRREQTRVWEEKKQGRGRMHRNWVGMIQVNNLIFIAYVVYIDIPFS